MASTHDTVVEAVADILEDGGWDVAVDHLPGYDNPDTIRGHVPDIQAEAARETRVVEVETSTSDGRGQRRAFKQWAKKFRNRSYKGVVAHSEDNFEVFEEE